MVVRIASLLLILTASGLLGTPASADREDAVALETGIAARHLLRPREAQWLGRIDVPDDASALHVAVCASADVDLYLKRGRPAAGDLGDDADVASRGSAKRELISLTGTTPVRVRGGTWYVTVENPRAESVGASIEVVAMVDRPNAAGSLLPGGELSEALGPAKLSFGLRTFIPTRARAMVVEIDGADDSSFRYELKGPSETWRAGRAPQRIVVERSESPPGEYVLRVERTKAARGTPAVTVRARVRWVYADGGSLQPGRDPILRANEPLTVGLGGDWHPQLQRVRIPIERSIAGFEVEAENTAGADIDLYLKRSSPISSGEEDADYLAVSSGPRERLIVGGARELAQGTYYLEAVLVDGCGPVSVTIRMSEIPLRAGRGTWGTKDPPLLKPGAWVSGVVEDGLPGITWYRIRVPAGTVSMHAALFGAEAPLDLVLIRRTDGSIMRRAFTPRVDERLDHVFSKPPDTPRHFVLGVMNRNTGEPRVGFQVVLSFDEPPRPPRGIVWPPVMSPKGLNAHERVAAATVEITVQGEAGGSGACVTPRGHILTCRHVLETGISGEGLQRTGILIAFPQRFDTAPTQSFVARLVHEDADKDLALLEITADIFGRPRPKRLALPFVALGDDEALRLGSPVMVCGYPAEGSARTRTPIILTRGAVAGLERQAGALRWIKTDAWIGMGHSGGCLVDGNQKLVGIAAATLGPGDVLGLAVPLSAVPPEWRRLIEKGLGSSD